MDNFKIEAQPADEASIHSNYEGRVQESVLEEWNLVTLEKVADFVNGYAFKPSQWSEGGRPIIRIQNLTGTSDKINHFDGELPERYLVRDGDLLISWSASLGAFVWRGEEAWVNQHIFKVSNFSNNVDKEFLLFVLQAYIEDIKGKTRGSTMKHVTRKEFLATTIPLPPVLEQKAIAHVLSTVRKAIESTAKVIETSRELKRSLMNHLFTYGPVPVNEAEQVPLKETEIGQVPEHWKVAELGTVVTQAQYGLSQRGETQGAFPILRMNNLNGGQVTFNSRQYVDVNQQTLDKFRLYEGDLLFNRTNSYELVGKTALFDLDGVYVFASYLIRVVTYEDKLTPQYANYYLNSAPAQARLKSMASRGVSQSNINATKLKSLLVPLPPLHDQQAISHTLGTVDGKIAVEENRKQSLKVLFKTLLHNLMTGKIRVGDLNVSEVEEKIR